MAQRQLLRLTGADLMVPEYTAPCRAELLVLTSRQVKVTGLASPAEKAMTAVSSGVVAAGVEAKDMVGGAVSCSRWARGQR